MIAVIAYITAAIALATLTALILVAANNAADTYWDNRDTKKRGAA